MGVLQVPEAFDGTFVSYFVTVLATVICAALSLFVRSETDV